MDFKWGKIKVIISDFDGVMTDNRVLVDEMGKEAVFVNRADGQAIHMLRSMGMDLVILSTERNSVVKKRAEKLNVVCIHGISDKAAYLRQYCEQEKLSAQEIAYVGNDENDYEAMQLAGLKIVPSDAFEKVKGIADYVTETKGGYGVIREIAELMKKVR